MNCHKCNSKADWIVQSVNLSYWYCKTCKIEPIDVPELEEVNPPHSDYWLDSIRYTTQLVNTSGGLNTLLPQAPASPQPQHQWSARSTTCVTCGIGFGDPHCSLFDCYQWIDLWKAVFKLA